MLLHPFFLSAQQTIPPIGLWRDHLPYGSVIDIAGSHDRIYCATPYSLFSVNKSDKGIERFSRVTGLSETGISAIDYDEGQEKLFIAYSNSNIDILYRSDIFNIPDIKRDNIAGDKTVHKIYSFQNNYYLSSGLGVIVVDGQRYEVNDTWLIGNGGTQVKVNGLTTDQAFFYAATEEGLKKAPLNSTGLSDFNNWQLVSGASGLPDGSCQDVWNLQGNILVQKDDSLFLQTGTNWHLFYTDEWQLTGMSVSENKVSLCQRKNNGDSRVTILNSDGSVFRSLIQPNLIRFPRKVLSSDGDLWIADQEKGLSIADPQGGFESIVPDSPAGVAGGEMVVKNNILHVAAGGVDENWNRQNNPRGLYRFQASEWTNINTETNPQLDSVKDIVSIAIDPTDGTTWAGSFGDGLVHYTNSSSIQIFKQNFLSPVIGSPASYRVAGLSFDRENNLWISNYGAAEPLMVRKSNGEPIKFAPPFFVTDNAFTQVLVDDNNYKWIIAAKAGGLIAYDHGPSLENTGDDRWKKFTTGAGSGNLPGSEVLSVARDKNGFVWIGTNNGIGVIQCPQEIFGSSSCEAIWPVVAQGNFAGYLFKGEEVKSIAVDGADRKWIATKKGAWLISSTGEEVIYQFTEENSPLLSNDVNRITIDGTTGEVFFSTAKGICSFRSTATEAGDRNENVLVFPNPVPPGYTGSIGIRGLVNDAIVKITELNGRLVWQARALGGQAVWDGRDYKGRRISTGVYLVLVSNDGRTEKTAARIVFINR